MRLGPTTSKCIGENESRKAKPQRELKVKEDIKNIFSKFLKGFVGSVLIFSSRQHVEFIESSLGVLESEAMIS